MSDIAVDEFLRDHDAEHHALTGEQILAGRAMGRIAQTALAREADISTDTLRRLERTFGQVKAKTETLGRILAAFQERGVVFDMTLGRGPGVRLASDKAVHFLDD